MVGIVSVGSLRGGGDTAEKPVTHRHSHSQNATPLVQQSGSDPLASNGPFLFRELSRIHGAALLKEQIKKCVVEKEPLRKVMLISAFLAA